MADTQTRKVLLVEPAGVVAAGLRKLLADAGGFRLSDCDPTDDQNLLPERVIASGAEIVIVDPAIFGSMHRGTVRTAFPALQRVTLVAICHTLYDEETLREYDGVLSIYDSAPQLARKLRTALEQSAAAPQTENYELSEREREMLVSIARGMTNKEIADRCNISIHTVISHRKNISRKTGIKTIAGLTVYALLNNIISESDL